MLGSSLLVAPIFVPQEEETEYYIPSGCWTSFFHPERTIEGPVWVKEIVPLDEIPVWVRPGTILCLGIENTGRPDYEWSKGVEVQLYELGEGEGVETSIPSGKGVGIAATVRAEKSRGQVRVKVESGECDISTVRVFARDIDVRSVSVGGGKEIVIDLK